MNLLCTNKKGFTLVELILVMLMLGILATIAIMQILGYRERSYNATLQSDLRSVYTASMQFHLDNPGVDVTENDLETYGYVPSDENIQLTIDNGSEEGLLITAGHPGRTPNVYQVDHAGRVSKQ